MEKNEIVSDQMIPNCLIWQERAKNSAVNSGSAAVSSQFHIVPL